MSEEECDDCGVVHGSLEEIVPRLKRRSLMVLILMLFCAVSVVTSMYFLVGKWGAALVVSTYGTYFAGINYRMLSHSLDAVEEAEMKMLLAEAGAKSKKGEHVVGSGNYI